MEASNTQNNEMEIRFDSRSENEGFALSLIHISEPTRH